MCEESGFRLNTLSMREESAHLIPPAPGVFRLAGHSLFLLPPTFLTLANS
jgi:hypothetical protein